MYFRASNRFKQGNKCLTREAAWLCSCLQGAFLIQSKAAPALLFPLSLDSVLPFFILKYVDGSYSPLCHSVQNIILALETKDCAVLVSIPLLFPVSFLCSFLSHFGHPRLASLSGATKFRKSSTQNNILFMTMSLSILSLALLIVWTQRSKMTWLLCSSIMYT